jgi:hypothetical protein
MTRPSRWKRSDAKSPAAFPSGFSCLSSYGFKRFGPDAPLGFARLYQRLGHPDTSATDISLTGRLIAHQDGSGTFRIKDGLIQEVHRKSDKTWIEISNLEQFQTPDGHYLPQISSVTYRDPKTGDIESNRSNHFAWTHVGNFYLPEHLFTIEVGPAGARSVRKITFSNHKLSSVSKIAE